VKRPRVRLFLTPQRQKLTAMNFLLGALFGFSTAIGGMGWLLYLLGHDDVETERKPRGLSGARILRPTSNST
jgi:hypothetical protein